MQRLSDQTRPKGLKCHRGSRRRQKNTSYQFITMTDPSVEQSDGGDSNKRTIIISNLAPEAFAASGYDERLPLVDRLKLEALSLGPPQDVDSRDDEDYYLHRIEYWSNLSSLYRVIIILRDMVSARHLYHYLQSVPEIRDNDVKLSLQENLLSRSKSYDGRQGHNELYISKSPDNFKDNRCGETDSKTSDYDEPEPRSFDVYSDLTRLGIDLKEINTTDQMKELKEDASGVPRRTRSLTKTLFKPDLKIDTNHKKADCRDKPSSPTITLDSDN
ncbi:Piso0_002748 [Millerozyma farinosa CBS 7064]|uniref:Piso0_002748 protein n=1 Tax=Pichia sorbitophila (strain ATCC MYA-4447 / BCRC 22081 / CBS 7064 / NBRC 10061 / NRRL Y-12695) TaxID=559304 RepID=G8YDE6_PICSO|nr:Piso0_002748 [Millerozyma farinosa CBS 7064]